MAPLEDYWQLIRSKEMERPGVAGAFWSAAPRWTVDADEWILSLLEQTGPEPSIPYFPCDIGFDAHERFSRNPAAVRRLIDAGKIGIAVAAACEENEPVTGMEPLLMELGENDEPTYARLAAWTLAYYYNRLHPNGERLGYVQRHSHNPDHEMFLLFSEKKQANSPYAVVLYPKSPRKHWSEAEAKALCNQIFPPEARGELRPDAFPNRTRERYYQRGYVNFAGSGKRRDTKTVTRITIGYRSDRYWNPVMAF